jgi:hypothetical protein
MRNINNNLKNKISEIKEHNQYFDKWKIFYEFIIMSYNFKVTERYSISDLFFELKKRDIEEAEEMIKVYAHGLYILAQVNGLDIYGGFYV